MLEIAGKQSNMFKSLTLTNVGPASEMRLDCGSRLNLLTGNNGLGKSFLLDIIWWCLTRTWPANMNPGLTAGKIALPHRGKTGKIAFTFTGKTEKDLFYESEYDPKAQAWTGAAGRPAIPGLVIYAMSDGSFAAWDPSRNYWRRQEGVDVQDRPPAYVLSAKEIWDGVQNKEGATVCNGLIRDWADWQKDKTSPYFENLRRLLERLSPSEIEILLPGDLTRISLDDVRDMPTLRMPYGQDVPIVHSSSGMRRIVALSYFLLWAWNEHIRASQLRDDDPSNQVIFLIDEIESHLHPSWQRKIVPSILAEIGAIHKDAQVQLIAATHSPLIMSSVEPLFSYNTDAWFDLDFEEKNVVLRKRDFIKYGEANGSYGHSAHFVRSQSCQPLYLYHGGHGRR